MAISRAWASLLIGAVATSGCMAMSRPPEGWITGREVAGRQVHGGAAMIWVREPVGEVTAFSGELLAVDHDSVLILMPEGPMGFARRGIRHGRVDFEDARGRTERRDLFLRGEARLAASAARFPGATTVRARAWLSSFGGLGERPTPASADSVAPR